MKTLLLFILSSGLLFTSQRQAVKTAVSKDGPAVTAIKLKTEKADDYEYRHHKQLITFVKLEGKKKLVSVKNEEYPENTDYIYNVLKDADGKVLLTEQVPYSQSGDWYTEYKHYYDASGKTIAFRLTETVFDESVKGGMAVHSITKYYDKDFKVIAQRSSLTGKSGKPITKKLSEFDFHDEKYEIYPTAAECLGGYHINLK